MVQVLALLPSPMVTRWLCTPSEVFGASTAKVHTVRGPAEVSLPTPATLTQRAALSVFTVSVSVDPLFA
ncbi:hypothetical protein [Actinokineospora sp. HUAS TT18]|uniref:hypothetical protein n=1 Tax=Actinokineospora sp. HUAS TT18 TaxID=3447451 RepID=UPI003F52280C